MGQYDLAEPAFGQACRLASKLADACYFQARALYALNRFEASLATMRKAGTGARVRLGEGQALEALGRSRTQKKRCGKQRRWRVRMIPGRQWRWG